MVPLLVLVKKAVMVGSLEADTIKSVALTRL
jgi:hypothetical protein